MASIWKLPSRQDRQPPGCGVGAPSQPAILVRFHATSLARGSLALARGPGHGDCDIVLVTLLKHAMRLETGRVAAWPLPRITVPSWRRVVHSVRLCVVCAKGQNRPFVGSPACSALHHVQYYSYSRLRAIRREGGLAGAFACYVVAGPEK